MTKETPRRNNLLPSLPDLSFFVTFILRRLPFISMTPEGRSTTNERGLR